MAPTILIVGATGNTGRSLIEHLPALLKDTSLSSTRILALTRSSNSATAQALAKIPGVEVEEQNWVEINEEWLRERGVVRAFVASHNEPTQFADESQFMVNALRAGVQFVVRISTTAANVHPDFPGYYTRQHWAIENLLDQPEFDKLRFSSLQPNAFPQTWLASAAELIKSVRKTGNQIPLRMLLNKDTPTGLIDPYDVGVFAAHLLAAEDTAPHDGKRYVLNGPSDVTGEQVVAMIEKYISQPVSDVRYGDVGLIDEMAENYPGSKNLLLSLKHAPTNFWGGKATASTTSKEVFNIYLPRITVAESLESMLK